MFEFFGFIILLLINAAASNHLVTLSKDKDIEPGVFIKILKPKLVRALLLVPPLGILSWVILFVLAILYIVFEEYFKD